MTLTLAMLDDLGACRSQCEIFAKEWPDGVEVTVESVLRAIEIDLDIEWFAQHFFSASVRKKYDQVVEEVIEEYSKAISDVQKRYSDAMLPVRSKYWNTLANLKVTYSENALAEYEKETAGIVAEFKRVTAPALAEANGIIAPAFVKAFNQTMRHFKGVSE